MRGSHLLIIIVSVVAMVWIASIPKTTRENFVNVYNTRDIYRGGCLDLDKLKVHTDIQQLPTLAEQRTAYNELYSQCEYKRTLERTITVQSDLNANDMLIMDACLRIPMKYDIVPALDAAAAQIPSNVCIEKVSRLTNSFNDVLNDVAAKLREMALASQQQYKVLLEPVYVLFFQTPGRTMDARDTNMVYAPAASASTLLRFDAYIIAPRLKKLSPTTYQALPLANNSLNCVMQYIYAYKTKDNLCYMNCAGTGGSTYPTFCGCKSSSNVSCINEEQRHMEYGVLYRINKQSPNISSIFANNTQWSKMMKSSNQVGKNVNCPANFFDSVIPPADRGRMIVNFATPLHTLSQVTSVQNSTGDYTFSMWLRRTRNPSPNLWPEWANIFRIGGNRENQRRPALYLGKNGLFQFCQATEAKQFEILTFNQVALHTWVHYVFRLQGRNLRAFVNGAQVGTITLGSDPLVDRMGEDRFLMDTFKNAHLFGLHIAKFRFYDRAISIEDITELSKEVVSGTIKGKLDMVRYAQFHSDLRVQNMNASTARNHYANTGIFENRMTFVKGQELPGVWVDKGYLDDYADASRSGLTGAAHYKAKLSGDRNITLKLDNMNMTPFFNALVKTRGSLIRRMRYLTTSESAAASTNKASLDAALSVPTAHELEKVTTFAQPGDAGTFNRINTECDETFSLRVWRAISGLNIAGSDGHRAVHGQVMNKASINSSNLRDACAIALGAPASSGAAKAFGCENVVQGRTVNRTDDYVVEYTGWLQAPVTGMYTFGIRGNEGCDFALYIDGAWRVITSDYGIHAVAAYARNPGNIALVAMNAYPVRVRLHEKSGTSDLRVEWIRPDAPATNRILVDIPFDNFYCSEKLNLVCASQVDPRGII